MSKCNILWCLLVLPLAFSAAWCQDSSAQQPEGTTPSIPQQPVPAYGPDNTVPPLSENPPISGLDMPNLEPHAAPLSYLQAGAHLSEAVSTNLENSFTGSGTGTISDALGSLDLERLWSNYDLSLSYLGGVGYYSRDIGLKQIEELGMNQKITWKRGEFGIRDAFSYQPEGTFGSSYGSVATVGAALSGQGGFFGGTGLGALGEVPRIMNLALVDAVENLTPKSSVTVTGGYGFVHFLENDPDTGTSFIGNSQVSGQIGYDRLLGPHDQGALVYGYQGFQFSTGITFHSHVIQVMWGHRISGRMDFLIGAGPQFTQLNHVPVFVENPTSADTVPPCEPDPTLQNVLSETCPTNDLRISAAGRASLRYRFPKASLDLSYDHYITSGSGFFAGAESDIVHMDVSRPLGRIWTVFSNIGYSRNSRVVPLTAVQLNSCAGAAANNQNAAACPGVSADTYQFGYAGIGLRRSFGRSLKAYASYEFNDLAFDNSFCGVSSACNRISQRQIGTFGLDWTPRPIRLD
jgi:hypothetical protein